MARSGVGLQSLQPRSEIQCAALRGCSPASRRLLVVTESLGVGGTESHLIRTLPRLGGVGLERGHLLLDRARRARRAS